MSIEIRDIRKAFGSFVALDGVSLDLPTGQLIALLGPSGCGKTTLLRIIAGLEFADSGEVLLEGVDTSGTHVRDRRVGFVFQHYALFRHMTVFENVAFGLRVRPRPERPPEAVIRKKVNELLDLVKIGWLADRFPSQLSGGQRQRTALARALAVEPRVLLLDEPFGALDAKVRKELRRWLRRLHDELHITSVFVTHDQEEALEVADQIVLMNSGRVEQTGTAAEIYDTPKTAFAYSFLGGVNQLPGEVDGSSIRVGAFKLRHADEDMVQGQHVVAFARPHELEIKRAAADSDGLPARVSRILPLGALVRVELKVNGSAIPDEEPRVLEAELTRQELADLDLTPGQEVRLSASRFRVFAR